MIPIQLDHVSFTYPNGLAALQDITLTIAPGDSVALIGQNGAGKTTLARHLNGLLQPTTGRVHIGDWDTHSHTVAQMAARVGYVFQHPEHQLFKRNVRDEISFGPRNLGFAPERVTELVDHALHVTMLTEVADQHPHDLLPALRKRVSLASVLAMNTPIVVLDEPTTGQDASGLAAIGAIVEQLRSAGRTIITISHDIDFCADHCERLVVLGSGRVLLDGPREVVFARADVLAQTAVELPQLVRLTERLGITRAWDSQTLVAALEQQSSLNPPPTLETPHQG